jgi:hypothetical protein
MSESDDSADAPGFPCPKCGRLLNRPERIDPDHVDLRPVELLCTCGCRITVEIVETYEDPGSDG